MMNITDHVYDSITMLMDVCGKNLLSFTCMEVDS